MSRQPKWLDNAVFYEIYPQSFNDTNADGIGDINGIIEKLDYIKELGATAIWLNPCFQSPFMDAGYDISDFYTVAPRYGTNADLVRLFDAAHKRGLRIILDLVPGHTSTEHEWFKQSCKAEKNEYTDRYVWTDSVWNNGGLDTIRGIAERDGACVINFFSCQPALNYGFYEKEENSSWQQGMDEEGPMATRNELKNIIRFWLSAGCDGFRVDMAASLVKGDPDNKGVISLWQDVRAMIDEEFPDAAFVSEWGDPAKSIEGGFHMDFFLHFGPSHYMDLFRTDKPYFKKSGDGSIKDFVAFYNECLKTTDGKGLMCLPSGNHDMPRISQKLDEDERRVAFAFILSLPGAPFIYYGDEIGMKYLEGIKSVEGGFERTGSRSPMQWDKTLNAGFSSAYPSKLYIGLDESKDRPDAASQMADKNSLRTEIKNLIAFRQKNIALQSNASIEFISDDYPLVYKRSCKEQTITVIINVKDEKATVENINGKVIYTVGGDARVENGKCEVEPCSAVFIEE